MERNKYLKEVEEVLDHLLKYKIDMKKILEHTEGELNFQVFRYHSRKGEKTYERLLRTRKIKNLVDYLFLLIENKDN